MNDFVDRRSIILKPSHYWQVTTSHPHGGESVDNVRARTSVEAVSWGREVHGRGQTVARRLDRYVVEGMTEDGPITASTKAVSSRAAQFRAQELVRERGLSLREVTVRRAAA